MQLDSQKDNIYRFSIREKGPKIGTRVRICKFLGRVFSNRLPRCVWRR